MTTQITPPFTPSLHMAPVGANGIQVERTGGVAIITIARRERFNALDAAGARALHKLVALAAADDGVRVIVLRGVDGIFCSGADLKQIWVAGRPGGYGTAFRAIVGGLHCAIVELRRAPKPVVAAVDGVAAAGGLGLALACDLVVASERATFQFAYFKTALTGAEGMTYFLPRLLGLKRAMALALLDRRITAAEAHASGLVSAVYPTDGFDDEVAHLTRALAAGPTSAYAAAKTLMHGPDETNDLEAHLGRELAALTVAADGADVAEGIAAFFEKRPAHFGGVVAE